MSEKKPVIIYGASGYTGRLIVEFMRDQQIPFIAAGRNKERVEEAMKLVPGIDKNQPLLFGKPGPCISDDPL